VASPASASRGFGPARSDPSGPATGPNPVDMLERRLRERDDASLTSVLSLGGSRTIDVLPDGDRGAGDPCVEHQCEMRNIGRSSRENSV